MGHKCSQLRGFELLQTSRRFGIQEDAAHTRLLTGASRSFAASAAAFGASAGSGTAAAFARCRTPPAPAAATLAIADEARVACACRAGLFARRRHSL